MMKFHNKKLKGTIQVPLSKSSLHRMLFLALLNETKTYIKIDSQSLISDDVKTSLELIKKLNCKVTIKEDILEIDSTNKKYNNEIINCNECATTLRIIIPIILFLFGEVHLTGTVKLLTRPLDFYENLFSKHNIKFTSNGKVIEVKGNIKEVFKDDIIVDNCSSSQFISGLMYVLPFVNKKCNIVFNNNMESIPYIKMTADVLESINVKYDFIIDNNSLKRLEINNKGDKILPCEHILYPEIDYSSYAFWAVANELGAEVKVSNFKEKDFIKASHPDKEIVNIISNKEDVIDVKDCPDLLPILLVWTCFLQREIAIINFQRNRIKESNRVEGMIEQLNKLGVKIEVGKKQIKIKPIDLFISGEVDSLNDHRIAMAMVIASIKVNGYINIRGIEAVNKSYPMFVQHYKKLFK